MDSWGLFPRQVSFVIQKRQLRVYGHVAIPSRGSRPLDLFLSGFGARDRPRASWLCQVEAYLEVMGMTDPASAWAMARRRPKENRRKVDAATRSSGVSPVPVLT